MATLRNTKASGGVRTTLDDTQWARSEAALARERRAGRPPENDRWFVAAVLCWERTGAP